MGMAAPGVVVGRALDLVRANGVPRNHRPSTRPTTARDFVSKTGEPLWPFTTGWLRRNTLTAGADFSSCVDSKLRTVPGEESSRDASKLYAFWSFCGWSERASTDWPRTTGPEASEREETAYLAAKGFCVARRMATSCCGSSAITVTCRSLD